MRLLQSLSTYSQIPADFSQIAQVLANPGEGQSSKLTLLDFTLI
ncbi:hypothetical protein OH492_23715 [Vibrio chagasii]|nr:hypothetical protein [Vibrio chagasii]